MTKFSSLPLDDDLKTDLVLRAPLGRQFLTKFLGFGFEDKLFEMLGLGPVSGWRPPRSMSPKGIADWTEVEPTDAREVVLRIVTEGDWQGMEEMKELHLLTKLARVTTSFGWWDTDDAEWGLTGLAIDALRPVALALVRSPATSRWWVPMKKDDQRLLEWDGWTAPVGAEVEVAVRRCMIRERAENEVAKRRPPPDVPVGTRIGAAWWSAPDFAKTTWTTGAIEGIPTIALGNFIDGHAPFSDDARASIWTLEISSEARVLEVTTPSDWQSLVERFPRDVTGTHNGEWRYWGGVDGPWYLPDWEQVMGSFDGVHVTIGGYLSTSGLALPVYDGYTMLAGWIPDATLWLHDVATSRKLLGRWEGNPYYVQDWDDVRNGCDIWES